MKIRLPFNNLEIKLLIVFIVILMPVYIFIGYTIVSKQDYQDSDFFNFWLSGRMQIDGQNPYDSEIWVNNHYLYEADWVSDLSFPYPLPLSILFIPLGWMPFKNAFISWVVLSQIFIILSIFLLLSLWNNSIRKHYIFPLIISAFIFRPVLVNLHNGQLSAFLLFIIALTVFYWNRENYWLGSALLVLVELKTNIGLFIVLFIGIWLLMRKKFSMIASLVIFSLAILFVGMILDLTWVFSFINNGTLKIQNTFGYSPTVWGIAGMACSHQMSCMGIIGGILALIIFFIMIYCLYKYIHTAALALSLIIPSVLLITPYIWAYEQTLLIIPIVMITIYLSERGHSFLLSAIMPMAISMISVGLLFISLKIGNDSVSALIPLICYALTITCAKNNKKCGELIKF